MRLTSTVLAADSPRETGDADLPWVGGESQYDAELEDMGPDVVLSISNPACSAIFPPCLEPAAWLIDDLRLD